MAEASLNIKKNVIYSVVEALANILLLFVSYKLVVLNLGLEGLGLWSTLFAWISLLKLADVGMASVVARFVAIGYERSEEDAARYIGTALVSNMLLYSFIGVSMYFLMKYFIGGIVSAEYVKQSLNILPYLCASFCALNINTVISASINGLHLGYIRSRLAIFTCCLQLFCVLLWVPEHGLIGLALAQIVQYSVGALLGWVIIHHKLSGAGKWLRRFSWLVFKEMFSLSIRAQAASASGFLFEPISKIILSSTVGMAVVGQYEMAFKTVFQARSLIVTACTTLVPSITALLERDSNKAIGIYKLTLKRASMFGAIGLLSVSIASPLISIVWLGDFQINYVIAVGILSLGYLFNLMAAPSYLLGMSIGVLRNNIVSNCLSLGVLSLGLFLESYIMFLSCLSLALALGAYYVKTKNEGLLQHL